MMEFSKAVIRDCDVSWVSSLIFLSGKHVSIISCLNDYTSMKIQINSYPLHIYNGTSQKIPRGARQIDMPNKKLYSCRLVLSTCM